MGTTPTSRVLRTVLDRVQQLLDEKPDATGQDVMRLIQIAYDATLQMTEATATCRRCGEGIWSDPSGKWRHTDEANSVGCRAASFTTDNGWNDDLDRTWKAQPVQ